MKVTTDKQIAALLKEYPLIRDACVRFDLRPKTIEARNIKDEDCLEEIHIGPISMHNDNYGANFHLYFYDVNSLYLGQMESKRKMELRIFLKCGLFHDKFTKENMLEALNRICPVRAPIYALRTDRWGTELLLLKCPSGVSSLFEFTGNAVFKSKKTEMEKKEQAELEIREALKKEFGE